MSLETSAELVAFITILVSPIGVGKSEKEKREWFSECVSPLIKEARLAWQLRISSSQVACAMVLCAAVYFR